MLDLPIEFLSRMERILGDKYAQFLASLDRPLEKAIYVNENKISVDEFSKVCDFSLEPIAYEKAGFYVDGEKRGRHPLHHAGAFYIQEPNAMFTVNAHNFNGDEIVLDLCAAPGGKSIQIANRIPKGVLVSNEYVGSRSKILFSNVERMGLRNVIITNDTPDRLGKAYANTFDVVLVDAPCSGEGMFRRGLDVVNEWNPGVNVKCRDRQMDILLAADCALKSGGHLIYSTCTYSLEENEEVVRYIVDNLGYELINIELNAARGVMIDNDHDYMKTVRLYPHDSRGEGQFVALFKKVSDNYEVAAGTVKLSNSNIANQAVNDIVNIKLNIKEINGRAYHVVDESLIKKGVNYVTLGVVLGDVQKGRFEPAHNLFTAFGKHCYNHVEFSHDDISVAKYLRGDTIDVNLGNGYGAFIVNGCTLGGFKISDGRFKNHYPKGLRNQ